MHNSANDGYVDALRFFTWQFCMFVKVQPSILSLDNAALVRFRHKKHISCCVATKQHQVLSATNRSGIVQMSREKHPVLSAPNTSEVVFTRHHKYLVLSPRTGLQMLRHVVFLPAQIHPEKCPDIFSKTPSSVATNRPANVLVSHPQHLFFCHRRRWRCPDIPSKTTGSVCNRSMRTRVDITSKPSGFVSSGSWLGSLLIYMPRKRDVTRIL